MTDRQKAFLIGHLPEPRAVVWTHMMSQDTHSSDICQAVETKNIHL